jgi:thermitase
MAINLQDVHTNAEFDALTIEIATAAVADPQKEAINALESAVSEVLGTGAEEWTIHPVHASAPGSFDLLPPEGLEITVTQAFQLKYALEQQPAISFAEALFETNMDDIPEGALETADGTGLESFGLDWWNELSDTEQDPMWSLRLIDADQAWNLTKGADIRVGHPDSGYIPHTELDDGRILHHLEIDAYDGDEGAHSARNADDRGGNHGLSTASVIVSGEDKLSQEQFVVGVAPQAEIVPMRITKKGPPIFFSRSGPRRVRDAVYHAIDSECDVISMSMGGLGDRSFRKALQRARERNILLLAAAGNVVRVVVWPARYPETIAVAACTADRRPWFHSSRGPAVDVTAPGHNVWRAWYDEDNEPGARPSSGTSYAVATAAGAAVLWLAHHGRAELLARYPNIPLQEPFRRLLKETCDDPPVGHNGQFGSGIINVQNLLEAPLPTETELIQGIQAESLAVGEEEAIATGVSKITAVFDTIAAEDIRTGLAEMWQVPQEDLDDNLEGVEEELLFHMLTNPKLREDFVAAATSAAGTGVEADFVGDESTVEAVELQEHPSLHETLSATPGLSPTLKARLASK